MLFFIFISILVAGIILLVWYENRYDGYTEWPCGVGIVATVAGGLCVAISVVIMLVNHIGADAKIAANKARYESLVYEYENAVFDDDDDVVGKKELYNQIREWNEDVSYYQSIQRDFWVGIYYPNVFDQFKLIEYNNTKQ